MSNLYSVLRSRRPRYSWHGSMSFSPLVESYEAAVSSPTLEVAELSDKDVRLLRREADVMAVAPSLPVRLIAPVAERALSQPSSAWGIDAVGAGASNFDGDGTVVAVLDTGIDATHPAFAGVALVQKDFTGQGDGDGDGHGTHCAGTIFGRDVGANESGSRAA